MTTKSPHHLIFTSDVAENARVHVHCHSCGAPVGELCKNAVDGIHLRRISTYHAWLFAYNNYYRKTPIRPCVPPAKTPQGE